MATGRSVARASKKPGFSSDEYNGVATTAILVTIQLLNSNMQGSPGLYSGEEELRLSYGRELRSCRFDRESGSAVAIFGFGVKAENGEDEAFVCEAEYAVIYQVPDDAPEEAVMAFCKSVGVFAAYPYFRSLAAQMAWNAGLDLPPLPSISAMPVVPKKPEGSARRGKKAKEADNQLIDIDASRD